VSDPQPGGPADAGLGGRQPTDRDALAALTAEIVACRRCPRLVAWRELVASEKVRRFRDEPSVAHVVGMATQPESSLMGAFAARPNPSIERTSSSRLRLLSAAAHVER
jgi:uracil-DNA glycosylase